MQRLLYFGALFTLATSLSVSAQTATPNSAPAHVEQVVVHAANKVDALTIEIQTSGAPVSPDTQVITGPDRIVVDFPGALPSAEMRSLAVRPLVVDQGALRGIRAGLFFKNPPITRVVLDLTAPQSYRIATHGNSIMVTLSPEQIGQATPQPVRQDPNGQDRVKPVVAVPIPSAAKARAPETQPAAKLVPAAALAPAPTLAPASTLAQAATLKNASLAAGTKIPVAKVAPAVSVSVPQLPAVTAEPPPAPPLPPPVSVSYAKGLLYIHADKATLAQVLFEVQRQTHADIPIPAGAEQEEVVADLGPAPARDVLGALLNGSSYNFIFIGNEENLERVILTLRDPNLF